MHAKGAQADQGSPLKWPLSQMDAILLLLLLFFKKLFFNALRCISPEG